MERPSRALRTRVLLRFVVASVKIPADLGCQAALGGRTPTLEPEPCRPRWRADSGSRADACAAGGEAAQRRAGEDELPQRVFARLLHPVSCRRCTHETRLLDQSARRYLAPDRAVHAERLRTRDRRRERRRAGL